jgi:hypothetical protein
MILEVGNLSMQPCGSTNPARLGWAKQPEASLAWGGATLTAKRRQPVPRLCDRAPKSSLAGALVVDTSGGHVGAPRWPGAFGPTGVQEQGQETFRGAREPGRPCRLHSNSRMGIPDDQPQAPAGPLARDGSEIRAATVVSPGEGNEARRDGPQGVAVSHSTVEPGEPTRGTLGREGDTVS